MNSSTNDTHFSGNGLCIVEIQHGNRSLAMAWTDTFEAFEKKMYSFFAIPADHKVQLSVSMEREGDRQTVPLEIPRALWPELQYRVRTIRLASNPPPEKRKPTSPPQGHPGTLHPPYFSAGGDKTVYVQTLTGKKIRIDGVKFRTHTADSLKVAVWNKEGVPMDQQRMAFWGKQLEDGHELHQYNLQDGSVIHLLLRLRGGWSWPLYFREQREEHGPLPLAEPLDPSRFIKENFLCLHYKHRTILTSWNADFTAFTENAIKLIGTAVERTLYFFIELAIFGNKKMEVDPGTWPLMAGFISDIWASEDVPFPESQGPGVPNPGPTQIHRETTTSNRHQISSTTSARMKPSVFQRSPAQSTPYPVRARPDSNQATGQVKQTTGFGPSRKPIPATSNIGPSYPSVSSNLVVQPSNSAGVKPKRSIGERIRDKWRRIVS